MEEKVVKLQEPEWMEVVKASNPSRIYRLIETETVCKGLYRSAPDVVLELNKWVSHHHP